MKYIGLLLSVFVLFCNSLGAQNDKISFNESEHNFGVIGDEDGAVTFDFIMTNNSNIPVVIVDVHASCGCTTPSWTREPIEPRKTGAVTVSYNPARQSGPFTKSITITTNNAVRHFLTITGEVVKSKPVVKKATPEELYPVAIGNFLLKNKELSFERVDLMEKKTITLEVFNNSNVEITQKTVKLPKYITVDFVPAVVPAKTAAAINVNLEVSDKNLYGDLSGEITLLINGANQSFPYSAIVAEDFSKWADTKKANAGKINLNVSEINFGVLSSVGSKSIRISNSGKSALNIHTIKFSDPSISVSKANLVIRPNQIAEVVVKVDNKKMQSNLSSKLVIVADDPVKPISEITIKANKKL